MLLLRDSTYALALVKFSVVFDFVHITHVGDTQVLVLYTI